MLLKLRTGTGNGERGTGNGERGTGNREQESGNESKVYSGNRPGNSKWWTKEKKRLENYREQFGEIWGNVMVVNVSFYRLCPLLTSTFLLEQSLIGTEINKQWNVAWGKIESETSHFTPIPQRKLQLADCRLGTKLRIRAVSCLIRIHDNILTYIGLFDM